MHFPVAPLVPVNIVVVVDNETLPVGAVLITGEEIELLHTIDNSVIGRLVSSYFASN